MEQIISGLLQDFETGRLTRRQLIHALASGVAAGPAALAAAQKPTGKKDFYENGAVLVNKALNDPYEERAKAEDLELEKQREKENRWK